MKSYPWTKNPLLVSSFFAALLLARGLSAAVAAGGVNPVQDLTRSADFVFRGTVRAPGAANLSIVEPNAKTAIVRVDEVLRAGASLDDFTGREVTVFLSEPLKPGDQRVFFTSVRLLGESLGAQEVGRAAGPIADLKAQVRSAGDEILREGLAARLNAADLVVSGRVLSTRAKSAVPEEEPATEHDPQWREGVLEVTSVLKGKLGETTVAFWYPASLDVMWAQVPKPSVGLEGTWLLHRHAAVLATVDPGDLLSAGEARIATELVKP